MTINKDENKDYDVWNYEDDKDNDDEDVDRKFIDFSNDINKILWTWRHRRDKSSASKTLAKQKPKQIIIFHVHVHINEITVGGIKRWLVGGRDIITLITPLSPLAPQSQPKSTIVCLQCKCSSKTSPRHHYMPMILLGLTLPVQNMGRQRCHLGQSVTTRQKMSRDNKDYVSHYVAHRTDSC